MAKLDESKSFGKVFGSNAGIRYEQDGHFFDGLKREVDATGKVLAPTKGAESKDAGTAEPVTQEPASKEPESGTPEPAEPAEPKKAAAPKKAAPKKAPAKKSEPEGVKPMRDQVKDEQKGTEE